MKQNLFVIVALFALVGCKDRSREDAEDRATMSDFRDQMCKCADKACADKVVMAMTRWGQDMKTDGRGGAASMSAEDAERLAAAAEGIARCKAKAMTGAE